MNLGQPSKTARGAAMHRAAHQVFEGGTVVNDPFACAILGLTPEAVAEEEAGNPTRRRMRMFVAARSRFAEDALATAVGHGVRQVVVLGAGLDTFSLRNPFLREGLRVFEVDDPATQAWKRERLASIGFPRLLSFAPVDLEQESLVEGLMKAGYCRDQATFYMWLGVVPYLTKEAVLSTLRVVAGSAGSEVVFDYVGSVKNLSAERRLAHESLAARVAAQGEPLISEFKTSELIELLNGLGLIEYENLDIDEIAVRYFGAPNGYVSGASAGHLMWSRRP